MKLIAAFLTNLGHRAFFLYGGCASYTDWNSHYSDAQMLAVEGRTQEAFKEARLTHALGTINRTGSDGVHAHACRPPFQC